MNTYFNSADEFFGRTVEEYKNWLLNNTREQLEFVLLDLIRLSENKRGRQLLLSGNILGKVYY